MKETKKEIMLTSKDVMIVLDMLLVDLSKAGIITTVNSQDASTVLLSVLQKTGLMEAWLDTLKDQGYFTEEGDQKTQQ